jgi:hypothetical protein
LYNGNSVKINKGLLEELNLRHVYKVPFSKDDKTVELRLLRRLRLAQIEEGKARESVAQFFEQRDLSPLIGLMYEPTSQIDA